MSRIESLIPDPPGRHQGTGVRSVIPKATQEPEGEPRQGESALQAAARHVWEEHQRDIAIAAARDALVAAGMPPDYPEADALAHRVLAVMQHHD